ATMTGMIVGTLEYMAPEQGRGAAVDHRADIYAFGLILMDMLVGRRAIDHTGNAMADLLSRMTKSPAPVRLTDPSIPEAVDELIGHCVDPDPGRRYQKTEELAADLEAVIGPRTAAGTSRVTMTPSAAIGLTAAPELQAGPTAAARFKSWQIPAVI